MPQLKGLAEDFPMLGFGRAAVPRRATFQPSDQIIIQIADVQIPGHPLLHEIIGINDLTCAKRVKIKYFFAMSSSVLIPNLRNHDSCYPALCRDGRIESKQDIGSARLVARARKEITAGAPLIPKKFVDRIANGENALRVLREWRDMTQLYLSFKTDIGQVACTRFG
jgi:hypothetical protein